MRINYPNLKQISKRIIIVLIYISIGWYLKGRLSPNAGPAGFGMGEVYILAQKTQTKDVSKANEKISYIEAINEVSLLPQVTGTVEKVLFEEGSMVKEGECFFWQDILYMKTKITKLDDNIYNIQSHLSTEYADASDPSLQDKQATEKRIFLEGLSCSKCWRMRSVNRSQVW